MTALELKIPPPAVMLLIGALMWLASSIVPAFGFQFPGRTVLAFGLALAGLVVAALGFVSFRKARTTVDPRKPGETSSLVVGGMYKLTRNPMYLGLLLMLTGWAVWLANGLAFLFLPAFVVYISRFQIEPEERALARKFGPEYAAYAAKVRRWL